MLKRKGFTLAEVLITLGIIGIVAAMTIPTLLNSTNDQEYKSAIKKVVSAISQAVKLNVALDGADFSAMTNTGTVTGSVYDLLTKRLNVVSTASGAITGGGALGGANNYTLFLNDGAAVSFLSTATNCSAASAACSMVFDVNGLKRPNTAITTATTNNQAEDQYNFYFFNQQIQPVDTSARYMLFN